MNSQNGCWYFYGDFYEWRHLLSMGLNQVPHPHFLKLPPRLERGQYVAVFEKSVFGDKTLFEDNLRWYYVKNGRKKGPRHPKPQKFENDLITRSVAIHISEKLEREVVNHKLMTLVIYSCYEACLLEDLERMKSTGEKPVKNIPTIPAADLRRLEEASSFDNGWWFSDQVFDWKTILFFGMRKECNNRALEFPAQLKKGQYFAFYDVSVYGDDTLFDDTLSYYWKDENVDETRIINGITSCSDEGWWFVNDVLDCKDLLSFGLESDINYSALTLPERLETGQYFSFYDKTVYGNNTLIDDNISYCWVENGVIKPHIQRSVLKFRGEYVRRTTSLHFSGILRREVICHKLFTLVIYKCTQPCLLADLENWEMPAEIHQTNDVETASQSFSSFSGDQESSSLSVDSDVAYNNEDFGDPGLTRSISEATEANAKSSASCSFATSRDHGSVENEDFISSNLKRVYNNSNHVPTYEDSTKAPEQVDVSGPKKLCHTSAFQPPNDDDLAFFYSFFTDNPVENHMNQPEDFAEEKDSDRVYHDL